jgi:cytochrome c oxidase subunit 2
MSAENVTEKGASSLEKKILAASMAFILLPLVLIAYSVYKLGKAVPSCVTLAPYTKAEIIQHAPDRYEVHMLARMWEFEPKVIRVPKGSVVDFYGISEDVTHGFYVDGTNVNLMLLPNVVNYAQARFDKAGTFNIMCHEYCGLNHARMHAVVEVADAAPAAGSAR